MEEVDSTNTFAVVIVSTGSHIYRALQGRCPLPKRGTKARRKKDKDNKRENDKRMKARVVRGNLNHHKKKLTLRDDRQTTKNQSVHAEGWRRPNNW